MHWIVLLIIILGIGGVGLTFHIIDANDKQEVAATNRHQAKKSRQSIGKYATTSKHNRRHRKSVYDQVQLGAKTPVTTARINRDLKAKRFVGTALVVKNDRVIYQRAFGYANKKHHQKNQVTSQYMINSIQKSITAQLVMQAVQAGKLRLTDRLSQYYPGIKGSQKVTVRQMLDMTAGLVGKVAPTTTLKEKQVYQYAKQNAVIEPQKVGKFDYQPISYVLLAGILYQVTHRSYYQSFYQQLVTPLDLNHTSFAQLRKSTKGMTVGYGGKEPGLYQDAHVPASTNMAAQVATGNVTMSTGDLFRAEQAVINGSLLTTPSGAQVLHRVVDRKAYAGGLYRLGNNGYYGHGMGDSYESTIAMSNDGKTGVILLSNSFKKVTMWPTWSTEQTTIRLFNDINNEKNLN